MINKILNAFLNIFNKSNTIIVSEGKGWILSDISNKISNELYNRKITNHLKSNVLFLKKKRLFFASLNTFIQNYKFLNNDNNIIVVCYHINDLCELKNKILKVDKWIVSCSYTENELISIGVNQKKIFKIPLSIPDYLLKKSFKKNKIIENENDIINFGSFQKDGVGWGEGFVPKKIKGPELLVSILNTLNNKFNIRVVLTGPSRGFVKKNLDSNNIIYNHYFFNDREKVYSVMKKTDICLITSLKEGGPLQLLESMALGVVVFSTNVGMARDILIDGYNGYICNNHDDFITKISKFISLSNAEKKKLITRAFNTVKNLSETKMINDYIKIIQL